MNSLNQIIVEGNVVRQPESREIAQGTHVCTVPIAVDHHYKTKAGENADEVSYFDIETFGKLADACVQWCPKGRGIRVVGRLKQQRWKNEEGKTRSKISIIAEHVEFKPFFHKKEDNEGGTEEKDSAPQPKENKTLAMLAEAAAAAQNEQEAGEVAF